MAIADDWTIDVVDYKITYTGGFTDDRPDSVYTMNEFYSWLADVFDEPGYMQYPVPMTAQTPLQYSFVNGWFIDNESLKALYGGSLQTSGWTKDGAAGITILRWADSPTTAPDSGDIGEEWTGGISGATGDVLAVDTVRQVAWVRNTSAAQFQDNEQVTGAGNDPQFQTETNNGFASGENIWSNLYSVGSLQSGTEIYVGQEDDQMGGDVYHAATAIGRLARRIKKLDEWWDSEVDYATNSPHPVEAGHFDILVLVQEGGVEIDGKRLACYARQFGTVYSHYEFVGGVGNYVVVFTSVGYDLNSADGPYSCDFSGNTGTIVVGDIIENHTGTTPVGRRRCVITGGTTLDSATGTIEYYLIGENEALTTYDRTLKQLTNGDNLRVEDGASPTFAVASVPAQVTNGPAQADGTSITFANAQYDINEAGGDEEYCGTIDCNNVALASVYKKMMFLGCRGNQDGTTANTQDTLLPSAHATDDEAGEFYRAAGDITVPWDTNLGTLVQEGELVTNSTDGSTWTASGVVVALSGTTSGQITLTQVKGTWLDDDVVAVLGEHASNSVKMNGTPSSIVDNTGAPFGSFAGGRWFVARGLVLINVPTADANNWETIDLAGNRIQPPPQRLITFAGLVANARAAIFEVGTAGGVDVVKNQSTYSSGGAAGASTWELGGAIALDVPTTGWVRHVDASSTTGDEFRYEYSGISGTTVTLRTVSPGDDVCDAGGSATVLNDTGIATNFGTDGNPKVGMMVRNSTSGEYARVLRKISNDSIETTPLTGAGTWATGNGYELNTVVVAMAASDTYYYGFIDGTVVSGTELSKTIKYVHDTECVARFRLSSPDVQATRYEPYVQKDVTIQDADLTVTAVKTQDTIAA